MSSAASTRPVQQPPEGPAPPASPASHEKSRELGLTSATGLVIGSIIGTGVFTMPARAGRGGHQLAARAGRHRGRRDAARGPVRPAHQAGSQRRRRAVRLRQARVRRLRRLPHRLVLLDLRPGPGNAAIVASWVFYVDALFGIHHPSGMANWGIALIGLWIPAAINLAGVRQMAWFQNVTVVLKFLPLLFVGVVGWFFVSSGQLRRVQRLRRQPVQRDRHRGGRGAVLLHRRRGGGHDRQAGHGSRARTSAAPRCWEPAPAPSCTCWSRPR